MKANRHRRNGHPGLPLQCWSAFCALISPAACHGHAARPRNTATQMPHNTAMQHGHATQPRNTATQHATQHGHATRPRNTATQHGHTTRPHQSCALPSLCSKHQKSSIVHSALFKIFSSSSGKLESSCSLMG